MEVECHWAKPFFGLLLQPLNLWSLVLFCEKVIVMVCSISAHDAPERYSIQSWECWPGWGCLSRHWHSVKGWGVWIRAPPELVEGWDMALMAPVVALCTLGIVSFRTSYPRKKVAAAFSNKLLQHLVIF